MGKTINNMNKGLLNPYDAISIYNEDLQSIKNSFNRMQDKGRKDSNYFIKNQPKMTKMANFIEYADNELTPLVRSKLALPSNVDLVNFDEFGEELQ